MRDVLSALTRTQLISDDNCAHAGCSPLAQLLIVVLVGWGCGSPLRSNELGSHNETTGSVASSLRSPVPDSALSVTEVKERKDRIRAFFQERVARMSIVTTTMTDSGQVIDWIPQRKDHPAPPPILAPTSSDAAEEMAKIPGTPLSVQTEVQAQPWAQGPAGTVPVVRFDVEGFLSSIKDEDMPATPEAALQLLNPDSQPTSRDSGGINFYHATWHRSGINFGTGGFINIWNANEVYADDESRVDLVVRRNNQRIVAGTRQYPWSHRSVPHFFVFYATNDNKTGDWIGGWNTEVDGWQQVSQTVAPHMLFTNFSTIGGTQYDCDFQIQLYQGNWWILAAGQWAGYYPKCRYGDTSADCTTGGYLFSLYYGLQYLADSISWRGTVRNGWANVTPTGPTPADMGSGRFAAEGWHRAAYIRRIYTVNTPTTYFFWDNATSPWATDSTCYSVTPAYFRSSDDMWRNWFYFGGPGANAAGCL